MRNKCHRTNRGVCLLLLVLLLFGSCRESANDRVVRLVRQWEGRTISFPANSVFTKLGQDTVELQMSEDARYKILTYVDSMGCISCGLQLRKWRRFMQTVDSVSPTKVPFLFYFHPMVLSDLRAVLRRDSFAYPVCLDRQDSLNRLNRFPHDMMFQTFLLDKDNRVVAIGNPIHNAQVKTLYLRILGGGGISASDSETSPRTMVDIDRTVCSLGTFPWEQAQQTGFVLRNTGHCLLVVYDVTTSCGCTTVAYKETPVPPGDSLILRVSYKADKPEHFDKTVTVHCNVERSLLRLRIVGNAE